MCPFPRKTLARDYNFYKHTSRNEMSLLRLSFGLGEMWPTWLEKIYSREYLIQKITVKEKAMAECCKGVDAPYCAVQSRK